MPALLKIKRTLDNEVCRLQFTLDPSSLSEDDKLRIRKYGEPTIDAGGTFTYNSLVPLIVPTIVWATPAPINYGTALSSVQQNATSAVAGVFTYTVANGTILNVSTAQLLTVTFTPTDTTLYTTATAYVLLVVLPVSGLETVDTAETIPVQTLTPIYPTRSLVLPSKFIRVKTDLPYSQDFDFKDDDFGPDAQVRALAYQSSFVAAYTAAFTDLRAATDSFTGEYLVNI
jgi:hypothetical protein